jgi:hypothetical protein
MAVRVSRYLEPGAYIEEQVVQPVPAFVGLPRQICLIGEGDTCKTVSNERMKRGFITTESVTVSGTPARFDLDLTSDAVKSTMQLFLNGDQQVEAAFSVVNAYQIEIDSDYYDSTGTYTFSYQSTTGAGNNQFDELSEDVSGSCGRIDSVGTFPGSKNFTADVDYSLSGVGLLWVDPAASTMTGSEVEQVGVSFSGLASATFKLTVDGGSEQSVTFGSGIPDIIDAADVVAILNSGITGMTASDSSGYVKLTSATTGSSSSLEIGAGTSNSTLGFVQGTIAKGAGKNPAKGEEFFVTYKAARLSTEYNRPILNTSLDQLISRVGGVSSSNALALAGTLVFEQKPPYVYHIQVQNTGTGIAAQDLDYLEAIQGAELNPDITDVVVLGHPQVSNAGGVKALVRAALRDHIVDQSSLMERAERVGWFGMPTTTLPGDGETTGTFVYVATSELQVAADSPGRGRFVLVGPAWFKKTFRLADGTAKQLTLDSTYLAAGVCALNASFLSPSEGLLRKVVTGLDEVQEITKGDRDLMASNGVTLVYDRQGGNVVFDPVSTDLTSAEFREINVMNQKDNIAKRVRQQLDDTLVGVVPDDLAQFIFEVKQQIAVQLNGAISDGAIAPFQNDDGTIRNIDLQNDIIVTRRASDPTTYDFRFTFFVKFIAKRLFGTYSVSIPSGQTGA